MKFGLQKSNKTLHQQRSDRAIGTIVVMGWS